MISYFPHVILRTKDKFFLKRRPSKWIPGLPPGIDIAVSIPKKGINHWVGEASKTVLIIF